MSTLSNIDSDNAKEIVNTAKRVLKLRKDKTYRTVESSIPSSVSDATVSDNIDTKTVSVIQVKDISNISSNNTNNEQSKLVSASETNISFKDSTKKKTMLKAKKRTIPDVTNRYALRSKVKKLSMTNNAITKRTKKAVKGYRGDIDLHRWEVKRKFWNPKDLNTMKNCIRKIEDQVKPSDYALRGDINRMMIPGDKLSKGCQKNVKK